MKIFPEQPTMTPSDITRLEDKKYLRSWNCLNMALQKDKPDAEDLKRLILLEIEGAAPRRPILEKLIIRLQKRERELIKKNIKAFLATKN